MNISIEQHEKFLSIKPKNSILESTESNSITSSASEPSKSFPEMQNYSETHILLSNKRKSNPRLKTHLNSSLKCKYIFLQIRNSPSLYSWTAAHLRLTVQVEMSQILTSGLNSVQVYVHGHARYFIKNRIITQKEQEPSTFQLYVSLSTNGTDFTGWAASLLTCCMYQWMRGPGTRRGQEGQRRQGQGKQEGHWYLWLQRPSSSCD